MSKNFEYKKEILGLIVKKEIDLAENLFFKQNIESKTIKCSDKLINHLVGFSSKSEKKIEIFTLLIPLMRTAKNSQKDKIIIADKVISLYRQKKFKKSDIIDIFSKVAKKEYFKENKEAVKYIGSLLLKEFGNKDIGDNANLKDCYKEMIYSLLSQAIIKYNDLSYFDLEEPKFEAKAEIYIKEHNELAKDLIKDEIAKKFVNDDVKEESDKWKEGDESPALPKDIISSQLLQCLPKKPNAKPLQQDKSNVTDQSK